MKFTWDEQKRLANIVKHGIDFLDAPRIWASPLLTDIDDREDYGEARFVGVGTLEGRTITVVYAEPDNQTIRVISLRKATKYEREQYDEYIVDELGAS